MSDLFYINEEGESINSSQFLKNRGTCCKTNCLHCPYGFTLKNNPLTLEEITLETIKEAQAYIDLNDPKEDSVAASLLNSAFSGPKKKALNKFNYQNYAFISLKGVRCGLIQRGKMQVKEIYLGQYFQDQGLKEWIQSEIFF